jgi:hypothetical protein
LHVDIRGIKWKLTNENSYSLWHKRLDHISKRRIERFVSDEILGTLDTSNNLICVECIKSKLTNKKKIRIERVKDVLELVHMDIYGLFSTTSWNGQQYFIMFINDYSHYDYLFFIHEKSETFDKFKAFKAEVEN